MQLVPDPSAPVRRRAVQALLATLLLYALLVATHRGEFWPFSIYPMFSQAGDPWSRAVVRDVSAEGDSIRWSSYRSPGRLPGTAFALGPHDIVPIDLANFVFKTDAWTPERVEGLRTMFGNHLDAHTLLVMRVNGRLTASDSVLVKYVPYARLGADTTALHPNLSTRPVTQ